MVWRDQNYKSQGGKICWDKNFKSLSEEKI